MQRHLTKELIDSHREQVKVFQKQAGQDIPLLTKEDMTLALNLVKEESEETKTAYYSDDFIETLDGLADVYYVLLGYSNFFDLDLSEYKYDLKGFPIDFSTLLENRNTFITSADYVYYFSKTDISQNIPDRLFTTELDRLSAHKKYNDELFVEISDLDRAANHLIRFVACIDRMCYDYQVALPLLFDEVHRSNMSKFIDGHKDENTGKWIKGPSYSPADIKSVVKYSRWHW